MTTSAGAMQVVSGLLELDVPLILDADALNCLAKIAIDGIDSNPEMYRREQPLVMTPHYRELSRLVAGDEVNDLGTAIAAAQKVVWAAGSDNLVVIAKGPTTAICGVERVLLPLSGPASLATAGSGDVLAGILAGTLATMRDEMDRWELLYSYAVALHSYAGFAAATEYGEKSVIATDLIDLIGPAMELAAKDALEDLGIMDEEGNVTIKGRSKNLLLGPSGQNIYPEEIEEKLNNLPYVAESIVIQQNDNKLAALIYPDFDEAYAQGMNNKDIEVAMEENRVTLNSELPAYSQISRIKIYPEEFEKTPKKSIKRFLYQDVK